MNVPPVTHEKADNATVNVFIHGLALICFSQTNDRAETGFLKVQDKTHFYEIKVYRNGCELIWNSADYFKDAALANSILVINAGKTGVGRRFESLGGKGNDDEDIRWTVDLDDAHLRCMSFVPNAQDRIHSRVYINDGTFYTKVKSTFKAILHKEADPAVAKFEDFVGKVVGATVEGDEVPIELQFPNGSRHLIGRFKKSEGPFFVYLGYRCQGADCSSEGDFLHNYDVMKLPGDAPHKFDLTYRDEEKDWEYCKIKEPGQPGFDAVEEACQATTSGGCYKELPM
ncbi:MAG TPA: hypothetical protein VF599_18705 [Pyrinomonadaceae bacterium]|jgi:hypothetical protein